jgi:hypothetical protein
MGCNGCLGPVTLNVPAALNDLAERHNQGVLSLEEEAGYQ